MDEYKDKPAGGYDDKGGYGKGSWGKWVVIYLVIAVVVYGLIYWWYKSAHKTTTTGGTNSGSIY
jgi:hypothetical protein